MVQQEEISMPNENVVDQVENEAVDKDTQLLAALKSLCDRAKVIK